MTLFFKNNQFQRHICRSVPNIFQFFYQIWIPTFVVIWGYDSWITANEIQNYSGAMVGRIITPKDVHIIIPRTCEYTTLQDKGTLWMWFKVRALRLPDYCGLSRGLNLFPWVSKSSRPFQAIVRERDKTREERVREMWSFWLWIWRKKGRPRTVSSVEKSEKARKQNLCWEPTEKIQPCENLDFSLGRPMLDLRKHRW